MKKIGIFGFIIALFILFPIQNVYAKSPYEEKVDAYMEDYIGKEVPGAAVIYIENGEIVFSKGYGYADVEEKVSVDPNTTVFEYASISKTYTFTGIMQLVEVGRIDLEEDITTYFPKEFRDQFRKKLSYEKPIRVIDLMNHRTGFAEQYFYTDATKQKDIEKNLASNLLKAQPKQICEPDTSTAYSNYGAALAGYLIECVSGEEYDQYINKHIFAPLGVVNSTADPIYMDEEYIVNNKAIGYGEGIKDNGWSYNHLYPDGGISGTAEDLAKYAIAYMDNEKIYNQEKTYDWMFARSYSQREELTGAAHGFWEYQGNTRFLTHDGGARGFTSLLAFSPSEKRALIILCNQAEAGGMIYGLLETMTGSGEEIQVVACDNGEDAQELDGMEIITARKTADITMLYHYLEDCETIHTIDSNTIELRGLTYLQTKPDYYRLKDDHDSMIARSVYAELAVIRENGKIVGINQGGILTSDFLLTKFPNNKVGRILQCFLLVASTMVILVYFVISLYKRDKQVMVLAFAGLLMEINVIIIILYLLNRMDCALAVVVNSMIGIQYLLTASGMVCFLMSKQKKKQIILFSSILIFVLLQINWNFYGFI